MAAERSFLNEVPDFYKKSALLLIGLGIAVFFISETGGVVVNVGKEFEFIPLQPK